MHLSSLKPAAPVRVHLFLAALTWSLVGIGLFVVGVRWGLQWDSAWAIPLLVLAVLAGIGKAWMVLVKVARKSVLRIQERGDGRCIGGFLGWKSWLLVLLMMTMGRLLRGSGLPMHWVGLLYAGVGAALFTGSFVTWRAFAAHRRERRAQRLAS